MVALKGLSLPHLSLSRNSSSSPSRANAATPGGGPKSTSSPSNLSLAPSPRPSSAELKPSGDVAPSDPAIGDGPAGRPSGLSALGAALRRSSSYRSGKTNSGSSTPATLSPVISTPQATPAPPASAGSRPTSDSLLPPRHGASAGRKSAVSTEGKPRSKSSAPPQTRAGVHSHSPLKAHSSLPLVQSQPPLSRHQSGGKFAVTTPSTLLGTHTPLATGRAPALHNLEESYVGKVNLRLGEAVNKVFMAVPGPVTATDACWKGRIPPRYLKARELGELINQELRAALHDHYLLRTLLRTPVLKALSVFLTRLSALLQTPEPFTPTSAKDLELSHLPLSLRYNLQIVRCVYEVKHSLNLAPAGLEDVLDPWKEKLDELSARVTGPLVASLRKAVVGICARARVVEPVVATTVVSGGVLMLDAAAKAAPRALSIGRGTASPAPTSTTPGVHGPSMALSVGPAWLRDLAALLGAVERLFVKLECGADAERWLVSVGTCAVWKGILALACRRICVEDASSTVSVPPPSAAKGLFKSGKSGSPPESPNLHPVDSLPASNDVNFIRLVGELELFELRLIAFTASALSVTPNDGILHHDVMQGQCEDVAACGLCKMGRQFDVESSDEEDAGGARGTMAQCAMREAMQALSAMIVVVRATGGKWGIKEALQALPSSTFAAKKIPETPLAPITPSALLHLSAEGAPTTSSPSSPSPVVCPTLVHALDTLPTLLLLHILVSRLPPSVSFRLPHELWSLSWPEYFAELRGFAAAEEWTPELAWEMAGEVERCEKLDTLSRDARQGLDLLAEAIRTKVGLEGLDA